ncbi:hypothetical protein Rs2_24803 [Raphanus sativus]|nr:hypothetical protein Rs2_24803 [Raphanus sativus]
MSDPVEISEQSSMKLSGDYIGDAVWVRWQFSGVFRRITSRFVCSGGSLGLWTTMRWLDDACPVRWVIYTRGRQDGPGRMAKVKRRQVLDLGLARLKMPLCRAYGFVCNLTYMVFCVSNGLGPVWALTLNNIILDGKKRKIVIN